MSMVLLGQYGDEVAEERYSSVTPPLGGTIQTIRGNPEVAHHATFRLKGAAANEPVKS